MRILGKEKKFVSGSGFGLIECENGFVRIDPVRESIMRLRVSASGEFPDSVSPMLVDNFKPQGGVEVIEGSRMVVTGSMAVWYRSGKVSFLGKNGRHLCNSSPEGGFTIGEGRTGCRLSMPKKSHYYGFGEKGGWLDKRETRMMMWNLDMFDPNARGNASQGNTDVDPMYASIPFFIQYRAGRCHGIFIHSDQKSFFDLGMDDNETFGMTVENDVLDMFVIDGPEISDVVRLYTELTGRMDLPPLWALGYHQCRWSYPNEKRVREIAKLFRKNEIPCDAIWLDIDYMDEYKSFTFNNKAFPKPKKLSKDLMNDGFRMIVNLDPALADDPDWEIAQKGKKKDYFFREGKDFYIGKVWPGDALFPDFRNRKAADWFADLGCKFADEHGLSGLWFDMNEPADMSNPWDCPVHLAHGNLYAHYQLAAMYDAWHKSHPDSRHFFLTRSATAGTQRYASIWTGDIRSRFGHLETAIPMCCNLGLSGMPFNGSDVGGFADNCDGELFARWMQYGAFTPFFRNHSSTGTSDQEPWAYGKKVLNICREYTALRYRLLPYIYSAFHQAVETGAPIQRPMIYSFPDDERFVNEARQYMFGDHILVAPVTNRGVDWKRVRFPEGKWVDFHTGKIIEGPDNMKVDAPLKKMPVYIRGGAPIPMWPAAQSTEAIDRKILRVECYPGGNAQTVLYEDDGETRAYERGDWAETVLETREDDEKRILIRRPAEGKYRVKGRKIEVVFVGCRSKRSEVTLVANGRRRKRKPGIGSKRNEISVKVPDNDEGFEIELRY